MSVSAVLAQRSRHLVVKAVPLALAVAFVPALIRPMSSAALAATAAGADSVVAVDNPGIALHIPSDGRINGDGFAAQITGYRFAHRVGFGASTIAAAKGQRLLVFGLQGAPLVASTDSSGNPTPTATALLVVDGAQQSLPAPSSGSSGPDYWLASVPATASDVSLQMSMQGFTQTFSFTTGAREGPQPAVLYRTANSWQATDPVGQTVNVATPDPAESLPGASIDVTLSAANLTWFGPGGATDQPSAADQAWLVLDLTSAAHNTAALATGETLTYLSTLPARAIMLTVPGQPAPVPAHLSGQHGPADESTDQTGFFGGIYYWQVPADLTSASVKITPGTIVAENSWLGSPQSIPVAGSVTFPLSFGAPYQPPPPPLSPPADANDPASVGHVHSSGLPVGFIAVPVALILLTAGGYLVARRLRRRQPVATGFHSVPILAASFDPIALPPVAGETVSGTPPHPAEPPGPEPLTPSNGSAIDTRTTEPGSEGAVVRPTARNGSNRPVVLIPIPTEPLRPPEGFVRVDVTGTPRLWAWNLPLPATNPTVVELVALLALYPGERFTTEQLQFRLGRGRKNEPRDGTVRRYINEARRLLGEERVPGSKAGEGYWLRGVTTDAAQLAECVRLAAAASTLEQRARHLADALSLVRGAPFQDVEKGAYGWADHDADLTSAISKTMRTAAIDLASLAIEAGDGALGAWAAEKGRLIDATDDDILLLLVEASGLMGLSDLRDAWTRIKAGFPYGSSPSDGLVARYEELVVLLTRSTVDQ